MRAAGVYKVRGFPLKYEATMRHTITLIPGDGIGPEVSHAVQEILAAAGVEILWDVIPARAEIERRGQDFMQSGVLDSIRKNRVALKGPLATASVGGPPSINVGLRKALDLYANVRPVKNLEGVQSRYLDVDIVLIRENTEDLYAGLEHTVVPRGRREPENYYGEGFDAGGEVCF